MEAAGKSEAGMNRTDVETRNSAGTEGRPNEKDGDAGNRAPVRCVDRPGNNPPEQPRRRPTLGAMGYVAVAAIRLWARRARTDGQRKALMEAISWAILGAT
jgi:hypothetical protein